MADNQLGFDLEGGAEAPPVSRPATVGKWEQENNTLFMTTTDGYTAAVWQADKKVQGNLWHIHIQAPDGRIVLDGLPRTQTKSDAKDYSIGRINFHKDCLAHPIYRTPRKGD